MKFAIQGHPTRGKEVIQIFKDLGTENLMDHTGSHIDWVYLRDDSLCYKKLIIITNTSFLKGYGYKIYTLEEFEKEFPFKIGETVVTTLNHVGTIIGIVNSKYKVLFKEDSALVAPRRLKLYTEMKEERNITLTLDKAKEWYNKGGELREIALQAFSEKELNPLPRSWKEFCENYPIKPEEIFIDGYSKFIVNNVGDRNPVHDKNICPSRKSAEAHLAMIQLEQLRNCWRQGWEPDLNDDQQAKYCVICYHEEFKINILYSTSRFLSFPTHEMAKEFLECFRDLIEKAGDLI